MLAGRAALEHPKLPYALGFLSALLILPALWGGFQLDDHFQRFRLLGHGEPAIHLFEFYDGNSEHIQSLKDAGGLPWWAAEDLRHKSFRYLSVLSMQLDFALWPERPGLMHLHSLVWLAAMVGMAAWLYRETIGLGWVAGLAGLLFALEDAHAAPAAYLANRNALIATCLGVASIACFVRARRDGWRAGTLLGPGLLVLALCAGEVALATYAYLGAWVLFVDRDRWPRRIIALLPHVGVGLGYVAIYAAFEFGSQGSGYYVEPLRNPTQFLSALWERAPVLMLGQWTVVPADLALVSDPTRNAAASLQVYGLVTSAVLAVFMFGVLRREPIARFWCMGMLLSLVPISATGPQNRLLFFVGLGAMGLLAMFVSALTAPADRGLARAWRWLSWIVVGVPMLVMHVLLAPLLGLLFLQSQSDSEKALSRALATVPNDSALAEQDLILVNPPEHTYTVGLIPAVRQIAGDPVPRRIRVLSVGASPVHVTRVDSHSLDLTIDYGLFSTPISRYFRSSDLGFALGDRFEVADLEIEVRALTQSQGPRLLRYRFALPLEDPSIRWLIWSSSERIYVPWSPPPIGESQSFPASRGIFDS